MPKLTPRQRPLDEEVWKARRRVADAKDSMEACAARWIERNRRHGAFSLSPYVLPIFYSICPRSEGWPHSSNLCSLSFVVEAEGDEGLCVRSGWFV